MRIENQRGLAIVFVLTVVSLMSLMAASFSLSTKRETTVINYSLDRSKARALTQGGINYAMLMLGLSDIKKRWIGDGRIYKWNARGKTVFIKIFDESGKIDINGAQAPTLKTLFSLVFGQDFPVDRLVDSILDWRDEDEIKRPSGGEADDYKNAGLVYKPQNRNFSIIEELKSVIGIQVDQFKRLEPWLTVYSGQDGINPAKCTREQLIQLSNGNVTIVDNYLTQRTTDPTVFFPTIPGLNFQNASDQAYTIFASTINGGGNSMTEIQAVLRRSQNQDGGLFTIVKWKESSLPITKLEP